MLTMGSLPYHTAVCHIHIELLLFTHSVNVDVCDGDDDNDDWWLMIDDTNLSVCICFCVHQGISRWLRRQSCWLAAFSCQYWQHSTCSSPIHWWYHTISCHQSSVSWWHAEQSSVSWWSSAEQWSEVHHCTQSVLLSSATVTQSCHYCQFYLTIRHNLPSVIWCCCWRTEKPVKTCCGGSTCGNRPD